MTTSLPSVSPPGRLLCVCGKCSFVWGTVPSVAATLLFDCCSISWVTLHCGAHLGCISRVSLDCRIIGWNQNGLNHFFFCPGPRFGPEHRHQHQDTHPSGLPRPPDLPHHVLPRLRQQGLLFCLPVPTWGGGPVNGEMAIGGGLLTYTKTRKPQTMYPHLPVIPPCSGETEASDPRPDEHTVHGHPLAEF